MREFNKQQFERWSKVREKGKLMYAIKWVFILIVYIFLLQGIMVLLNRQTVDQIEIVPWLVAGIVLGILNSIMRWYGFERKWNAFNKKFNQQ